MEKEGIPHVSKLLSDRRQVAGVVVLLLVAAVTFGVSIVRLYSEIRNPFQAKATRVNPNDDFLSQIKNPQENREYLKTIDSDGDGLSDYDELYVYHTSPYLKDTDSDGFDDKAETEKGNDPNCPEGKACSPQLPSPLEVQQQAVNSQQQTVNSKQENQSATDLQKLTPDQIRDLLHKQGVPEKAIQSLDDKTLLQKFKESVNKAAEEQAQKGNVLPPLSASSERQTANSQQGFDLNAFSAAEIRTLLKQQPNVTDAQKKQLDTLSDEQVKKNFLEAYVKAQQKTKQ